MDVMNLTKQVEERYGRYIETAFYFQDPDFVGRIGNGELIEAIRDPGDPSFKVTFFAPLKKIGTKQQVMKIIRLTPICFNFVLNAEQ